MVVVVPASYERDRPARHGRYQDQRGSLTTRLGVRHGSEQVGMAGVYKRVPKCRYGGRIGTAYLRLKSDRVPTTVTSDGENGSEGPKR